MRPLTLVRHIQQPVHGTLLSQQVIDSSTLLLLTVRSRSMVELRFVMSPLRSKLGAR
jgi:hypothetical protein